MQQSLEQLAESDFYFHSEPTAESFLSVEYVQLLTFSLKITKKQCKLVIPWRFLALLHEEILNLLERWNSIVVSLGRGYSIRFERRTSTATIGNIHHAMLLLNYITELITHLQLKSVLKYGLSYWEPGWYQSILELLIASCIKWPCRQRSLHVVSFIFLCILIRMIKIWVTLLAVHCVGTLAEISFNIYLNSSLYYSYPFFQWYRFANMYSFYSIIFI